MVIKTIEKLQNTSKQTKHNNNKCKSDMTNEFYIKINISKVKLSKVERLTWFYLSNFTYIL